MSKIKKLFSKFKKNKPVENQYFDGNITYEEAMDCFATSFMYASIKFWEDRIKQAQSIEEHNEKLSLTLKTIEEELAQSNPENHGLNMLYLSHDKEYYKDAVEYLKDTAVMYGSLGAAMLGCCERVNEHEGNTFNRVENGGFIDRCLRQDIIERARKEVKFARIKDFVPTRGQVMRFIACCWLFADAMKETDDIHAVKCLNDEGLFINEDGDLVEENLFKDFVHVDYKGLV